MIPALFGAVKAMNITQKAMAVGVIAAVCGLLYGWGYLVGQKDCAERQVSAIAEQAQASAQQTLKGADMTASLAGAVDQQGVVLAAKVNAIERRVESHAKQAKVSCLLDPAVVRVLDEYSRLLNSTPDRVPASDGGTAQPEVSGAGMGNPPAAIVPDEEYTGLTLREMNQYVADLAEQYGRMKIKFQGLSEWDDQRLAIERQAFEEQP
jgi:hypothetical protein